MRKKIYRPPTGDQPAPMCYNCTRRKPNDKTPFACLAFPSGIPDEIINSEADHRQPFPGDNGILYDPINPAWQLAEFGPQPEGVDV